MTQRGNRPGGPIFFEDGDQNVYRGLLAEEARKATFYVWAYYLREMRGAGRCGSTAFVIHFPAIMMKTLTIVALALLVSGQQARPRKKLDAYPIATPVSIPNNSPQPEAKSGDLLHADVRILSAPGKDGYDRSAFWISVVLALIGIGGIAVGIYSLKAIKQQIDVQVSGMMQWLELEPDGLFTKVAVTEPNPPIGVTIHPRWRIVNNTPLPLTLEMAHVSIATDKGWEVFVFEFESDLLPPAKNANSRSVFVPFKLNATETEEFLSEGIELSIAIKTAFISASGKRVEQDFGDFYFCRSGHMEINHPIGKGPQRQFTEEDDEPSTLVTEQGFKTLESDEQFGSKSI